MSKTVASLSALCLAVSALAAPGTYRIDPRHTFPSFEADHQGGKSIWRGKITKTTGTITLDRAARSGTVDVTMDMSSISFGIAAMDDHIRSPDYLDVARYPLATYKGKLTGWHGDAPGMVDGELTLHGVTRPLQLSINSLLCKPDHALKVESCGADASGSFNRDDFGIDGPKAYKFLMFVRLAIQIEAFKIPSPKP